LAQVAQPAFLPLRRRDSIQVIVRDNASVGRLPGSHMDVCDSRGVLGACFANNHCSLNYYVLWILPICLDDTPRSHPGQENLLYSRAILAMIFAQGHIARWCVLFPVQDSTQANRAQAAQRVSQDSVKVALSLSGFS